MGTSFAEGLQLFNSGRFFDAHEVWEDIWRESSGQERNWMQGLVQLAAGMHHHSRGNLQGALSLLRKARANLDSCPAQFRAIDIVRLEGKIIQVIAALERNEVIALWKIEPAGHAT